MVTYPEILSTVILIDNLLFPQNALTPNLLTIVHFSLNHWKASILKAAFADIKGLKYSTTHTQKISTFNLIKRQLYQHAVKWDGCIWSRYYQYKMNHISVVFHFWIENFNHKFLHYWSTLTKSLLLNSHWEHYIKTVVFKETFKNDWTAGVGAIYIYTVAMYFCRVN